ncbi:MAG: ADP-ribosylation factor-like protein, partial [Trichodesmium sp. St18_bin1]|nr:ADP-ribosylation factor-like protein [Trichodesmium sp. St18_bin1]
DYIYEAKLLIVGEGGAGKTTLANKILNPKYQLKDEDTTKGIEVHQYNFQTKNQNDFQINIWDFGGQEIYHATHQFFLTKRSLYILVADTRNEDTDFYYWLNVVELLSSNSPLLIVKNEKQERKREINQRALQGQFTNIKEILATNLATNRGLAEIIREIQHHISKLPHIGSRLPKTWKKVRETLELDSRNYINLEEYLSICEQNGFERREDKLQLSGYLHDLGICLHFQDDPLLNKTVILKPEWGTAAVYKALDSQTVRNKFGKFNKDDLTNIWNEKKYLNMCDELLQLMIRFKLCYKIPGNSQTYIAPQLLTENQLEYDWDENNNLILSYTYEFMPKGIITQFIVAMHKDIEEQKYVWKSGVILKKNETRAEVIEDYNRRKIKIRVSGKQKR